MHRCWHGSNTGVTIDTAGGLANIWVADAGSSSLYRYKPGTSTVLPFPTATIPFAVAADGTGDLFYTSPSDAKLYELPGAATGFQKSAAYLGSGRSLVIDQSGNIWIGLDGANSITQIVGAAVPVWQPYANGLSAGHFQVIP